LGGYSDVFRHCLLAGVLGLFAASTALAQDVRVTLDAGGTDDTLTDLLRANSLTYQLRADAGAEAQDLVAAARADYQRILTGLYARGYYGGTISIRVDGREAATIDPLGFPDRVSTIEISVAPGSRFTFGQTAIAPLPEGAIVADAFAPGQPAQADVVRAATADGVEAWRAEGHALAAPAGQSITALHPETRLDVAVTLDPGPRLQFGPKIVTGNESVRTERILAIAGINSGLYDPAVIARAESNLRRQDIFQSATIVEGDAAVTVDQLPLEVQVVERLPRRLGFGAEYSSIQGATLSAFWMHRNLLGGAERLRIEAEASGLGGETGGEDFRLSFSFLRPATFNQANDLYADLVFEDLEEPDYSLRQTTTEIGIIRRLDDDFIGEFGLGYRFGTETDALGQRDFALFTLPLEATLDRRDDPFDARAGFYANLAIMPFLGVEGSDDGVRIFGDGRIYRSIGAEQGLTFALRGQVGSVIGPGAGSVPADFLFFSGGGGTVRGQPYQSLGIDAGGGLIVGGNSFLGVQAEARFDVTDRIGLVGFYDAGHVGAAELPTQDGDWHGGAGLGLRYDTGIGPIRLDLATPATGDDAWESLSVYIGIGQAF